MKVRKNPSAQRASKAPFLMEIIWSILRSAFCQDEKCSDRLCTASRPFFFRTKKNRVVACALHALLLEQGPLL